MRVPSDLVVSEGISSDQLSVKCAAADGQRQVQGKRGVQLLDNGRLGFPLTYSKV